MVDGLPKGEIASFKVFDDVDALFNPNKSFMEPIALEFEKYIKEFAKAKGSQPFAKLNEWLKVNAPCLEFTPSTAPKSILDIASILTVLGLCTNDWQPSLVEFDDEHKMNVPSVLEHVLIPKLCSSGSGAPSGYAPSTSEGAMQAMMEKFQSSILQQVSEIVAKSCAGGVEKANSSANGAAQVGSSSSVTFGSTHAGPNVHADPSVNAIPPHHGSGNVADVNPSVVNAVLEALKSTTATAHATQRALQMPGIDAADEEEDMAKPLDSKAMMFRPMEWFARVNEGENDELHRHMLMQNLRTRFHTTIPKLNHQLDHLLGVADLLLQDNLESALDLICDRMHFLLHSEHKCLEEAVSYYEELRGDNDKTKKYRQAAITAAMKTKDRQRGRSGLSHDEHNWFNRQRGPRGRTDERRGQPQHRANSAQPQQPSNPFVESFPNDQGGGAGAGGRRSRRRRRGGR